MRVAAFVATLFIAAPSLAADTPKPASEPLERKGTIPTLGANVGFIDASRRLGPSFDLSLHVGVKRSFGPVALGVGLRPHWERFAIGYSDDLSCDGKPNAACGSGSVLYLSQTTANALSLEIPFIADLNALRFRAVTPFVGVAPWLSYVRATEQARGLVPTTEMSETSTSHTFFGVGVFGGLAAKLSDHGRLVVRFGYRYMPYADMAGHRSSLRGELASIGYLHEL